MLFYLVSYLYFCILISSFCKKTNIIIFGDLSWISIVVALFSHRLHYHFMVLGRHFVDPLFF